MKPLPEPTHFSRQILDQTATCHTFNAPLNPGDYRVPFSFVIPENVPASIFFEKSLIWQRPVAHLNYVVDAVIKNMDESIIDHRK